MADYNPFGPPTESMSTRHIARALQTSPSRVAGGWKRSSLSTLVEDSSECFDTSQPGPMPVDRNGSIVHEGLNNPGFVMDCMAWDLMDDYTGVWKTDRLPPLHYFDCLRFLIWADGGHGSDLPDIRAVPLPKKAYVSRELHLNALGAAYVLWAEEHDRKLKQRLFGAQPLPAPVGPASKQIWNDSTLQRLESQSLTSTEHFASPIAGGVSLRSDFTLTPRLHNDKLDKMGGFQDSMAPSRADSVVTAVGLTSLTHADRSGTSFSNSSSSSPIKHARHGRQLSALAASFRPTNLPAAAALSSQAALPKVPGQLPGTFDILAQCDRHKFTCLVITDVPFNVTINEILTHLRLGEREGLVHYGPDNPAVHIIQDRSDSKTHEVYVEMLSFEVAARVIRDIPRRGIKIGSIGGSRKIRVELCGPDVMMRAIFPRPTKNHPRQFRWMGYEPDLNSIPDSFIGYVSPEDLHNAREWAEHPRKAKHADDAPQRVYEFMISTLVHLPKDISAYGKLKGWRTVQDFVDRLFNTVTSMIRTLNGIIDDHRLAERHVKKEHVHLLNFRLLKKFNQTCFDFPLFSDAQREHLLVGL